MLGRLTCCVSKLKNVIVQWYTCNPVQNSYCLYVLKHRSSLAAWPSYIQYLQDFLEKVRISEDLGPKSRSQFPKTATESGNETITSGQRTVGRGGQPRTSQAHRTFTVIK